MNMRLLDTHELPELPITAEERDLAVTRALLGSTGHEVPPNVFAHVERPEVAVSVAVREPGHAVTYQELATRARRIAALLHIAGVGEGDVVAVGGRRGVDVVAAFLAAELIGAVYLPVDASWPVRRVHDVLIRAGARLLLTTAPAEVFEAAPCQVVPVAEADTCVPRPGTPCPSPEQPRYVLYTSGSTGTPKGAVVEQRGMMNHLLAKVVDLGLTVEDRVAQTAPLVFDISLWQMLAPLLVGAEVLVLPDEQAQDATALGRIVVAQGVTVLEVVPTVLRLLLDEHDLGTAPPAGLRWVLATGEELPPDTARRCARSWPGVTLLNAYGPTECSDDVTHHVVGVPDAAVTHLPIGGPILDTVLHVLRSVDGGWRSCAAGEVGELFVGGAGVGRGYLGEPDRTRAAFYRDPFHATATGRLYRTGDAAVVLPGGIVEYRGRVDRQVKIAGVRMELGEIEAVLRAHPAVAACAVAAPSTAARGTLVARESKLDSAGERRLVAYVCPRDSDVDTAALRDHLARRLPLPMVPQRYAVLSELPLTDNGKVDYAALAALPATAGDTVPYAAPAGVEERAVADAMAELLDRPRVGRDESFVAAGGDSLLAIRLIARLRAAGYQVTMRDVLLGGTVAGVAARLAEVREEEQSVSTSDYSGRRALTPQQSGVYFHWRLAPDNPYYSYQGSLRLTGPLDLARLTLAWQALLDENPVLLSRFVDGDEPWHEYPHWTAELPAVTDLGVHPPEEREKMCRADALAEAAEPFDLTAAPAVRLRLFRLAPDEHRLLVTMHEILLDGWGATVLFSRLAELYGDPAAPGDPHRYDRYLDRQARALAGDDLVEARDYWRRQLSGELPVLTLPAAESRTSAPTYRGELVEQVVNATTTARLRELGGELGCTPFMVVLAAYALALGYHGGADEVVIGAPIANREDPRNADVPAFLINMLPLRIPLAPEDTAREHLAAVRDIVIAGYAASAYPFGWMLRDLRGVARSTARTPVFQTMLNHLTYPSRPVTARGVTFAFTELDTGFTKYDCSLYVQHHAADELLVQLAHQIDVVDANTARRLLESTLLALHGLTGDLDVPVSDIDLLPVTDRALLEEFSHAN